MTHLRQLTLALIVLFSVQLYVANPLAADESSMAGLVVDYGNGTLTYAVVPLPEDEMSGMDLLRRSGLSLVSIEFGGLGDGVCSIEEHGCGVGDCRRLCQTSDPNSPFWHYYVLSNEGEWEFQPRGASSSKVVPGQVDGWSWTGDQPGLPQIDFAEVLELAVAGDDSAEAAFTTYDASGQVLVKTDDDPPWLEYGAAGALAAAIAALMLFTIGRRTRTGGLE